MELKKIREQFPALKRLVDGKRLVYLDNACSVLKPRPVIQAVERYLAANGACAGGRSGHALSARTEEACHEVRRKTAEFLNAASPSEIIFTRNTTEGLNLVARSLPFTRHKNEVLVTALDHHSNMLPFLEEQRKGNLKLRIAAPGPDLGLDADRLCSLITDRTALVSIPRCSNVTGQFLPVREAAAAAHSRGALLMVDAAQSVPSGREDVRRDGIDLLAFSGHKLGAPPGIGALYCRSSVMRRLRNFNVGGGTVSDVVLDASGGMKASYFDDHRRFEAGIQDYAGILGLGAALDFLSGLGPELMERRTGQAAASCRRGLAALGPVRVLGPEPGGAPAGPIVSFVFRDRGISAHDFNIFLNQQLPRHVVCIRCGSHCAIPLHRMHGLEHSLRLSFFAYNSEREVGIFIAALEDYLRAVGAAH